VFFLFEVTDSGNECSVDIDSDMHFELENFFWAGLIIMTAERYLIGESSWDKECFNKCVGSLDNYFLHNDYFSTSNKHNTKVVRRIISFFLAIKKTVKAILNEYEIYYSSLNAEVMLVALLASRYKKSHIFIPNVIGELSLYGKVFRKVIELYSGKVLVTDVVTYESLSDYNVNLSNNYFEFNLPPKEELDEITYIVAFPAAFSHKNTKNHAMNMYKFSECMFEFLKARYTVYILPHPRDREYIGQKYENTICSGEIKNIDGKVCCISLCSSLSLNRRYGGDYGCWVSIDESKALISSLGQKKAKFVDIDYFK